MTSPTEHDLARIWRETIQWRDHKGEPQTGMSQRELADRAGWSQSTVFWMEKGTGAPRRGKDGRQIATKLDPWAWRRYKYTCAGLDAELRSGNKFDWKVPK